MTSVFTGKFYATNNSEVKLQIRATFKRGGRGSAINEFTSTYSRYTFSKEKEFSLEDVTNVPLSLIGTELDEDDVCGIGTWYERTAGCP